MSASSLVCRNDALLAGPLGSFEAYAERVSRIPVLNRDEEAALARRLNDQNDLTAARTLVLSHLRFVLHIARGYTGYGLPMGDLVQEGNVGLMKAVKRFNPDMNVRLVSFAVHWIRAEIHDYVLRNWRLVKIATTKAQRKLFFNLRGMKQDSSTLQPAEVQSIAAQLGVKPEEVVEMETRLTGRDIPLDAGNDDEDERFAPIAYLPDPHAEPSEQVEQAQLARLQDSGLRDALASLDDRSRAIMQRRWLSEGDSATLHELAAEYGVSAERIRQIEAKAMQKMRGMLAAVA